MSAWVITAPIGAWRWMMLIWALWMAREIAKRLPKLWGALSAGGLWRAREREKAKAGEPEGAEGGGKSGGDGGAGPIG